MQKLRIIKQDKKSETFDAPKLAISPYFIGLCRIETLVHPLHFFIWRQVGNPLSRQSTTL